MKRIYLLSLLALICSAKAFAQKSINVQVTMKSPTANQNVTVNQPFNFDVEIKNLGPDSIRVGDTLLYTYSGAGGSTFFRIMAAKKAVNDTIRVHFPSFTFTQAPNGNLNFCFAAIMRNTASGITDPDTTNNADCKTINIQGGTNGIQTVSTGTNPMLHLTIAPNPATDQINLSFTAANAQQVTARVIDITGREVIRQNFSNVFAGQKDFKLDVSNLSQGAYFVELNQDGQKATGRFIKQ